VTTRLLVLGLFLNTYDANTARIRYSKTNTTLTPSFILELTLSLNVFYIYTSTIIVESKFVFGAGFCAFLILAVVAFFAVGFSFVELFAADFFV
jgi:hypothetical protein